MSLWLVLLLLACILSPLTWLIPSRHQRGQMDVRLQARRMGLAMQLSRQEWPHWLLTQPPGACAQYHLGRRGSRRDSWCYWQAAPGQWMNQWREPVAQGALAEQLARLPVDVFKAEASPQMVALCWGERGQDDGLQRVFDFLQAHA